jgi:hypothetical protein
VVESGGGYGAEHVARGEGTGEAEDHGAGIFAFEAIDAEGGAFPDLSLKWWHGFVLR